MGTFCVVNTDLQLSPSRKCVVAKIQSPREIIKTLIELLRNSGDGNPFNSRPLGRSSAPIIVRWIAAASKREMDD